MSFLNVWPFNSEKGGFSTANDNPNPYRQEETKDEEAAKAAENFNVGHGFDPRALERGAKAIKEIDKSPHAKEALRLTFEQERTRQEEFKAASKKIDLERAMAGARAVKEQEIERRKTLQLKREEDKKVARYKSELDAKTEQYKQKKANEHHQERLRQTHEQFLLQQEMQRKQEEKLLEERKRAQERQAVLDRETNKLRAIADAEARIKHERENFDVIVKIEKAKKQEDRKTQLEALKVTMDYYAKWGTVAAEYIFDPSKGLYIVGGITLMAGGIYTTKNLGAVGGAFLMSKLGKPPLIRETSRFDFGNYRRSVMGKVRNIFSKEEKKDMMSGMVFPPQLEARLRWITTATLNTKKHNAPFRHALLHGSPGTGKTLFSKNLAKESGLDYAILTGGDFGPLGKDAVHELHKVFDWAEKSKKGTILFIDEADAFLQKRVKDDGAVGISEDLRNVLSAFLYRTGTESSKFMVVLASNIPESLDPAVLDRIDDTIEFELPGLEERKKLLSLYFDVYINQKTPAKGVSKIMVSGWTDRTFDELATETEGFSGRQLAKFIISLQSAVYSGVQADLTPALAFSILQYKSKHDVTRKAKQIAEELDLAKMMSK